MRSLSTILVFFLALVASGCGAGKNALLPASDVPDIPSPAQNALNVTIAISPSSATIPVGGNQAFTGIVTGTTNTAVTWSVVEGSADGTINGAGLYSAPQAAGTYHVQATSLADPSRTAIAAVTVTATGQPVSVSIFPLAVSLPPSGAQTFAAIVTGSGNTAVSWSVLEGSAGGTITNEGAYAAPQTSGTYHVMATSQSDPTKTATATVTVVQGAMVTVTMCPDSVTLSPGDSVLLSAFVTGANDPAVTWSVLEGAAGGSVNDMGGYTAPQMAGVYHVVATSVANPSKSGIALVTVVMRTSISPTAVGLPPGGVQTFTATVIGTDDPAVTWTIQEGPAGGTISATGSDAATYTAPAAPGMYHVVATAVVDNSTAAVATVVVSQSVFTMVHPHVGHTATRLADGKVLVVCGWGSDAEAEIIDPIWQTSVTVPTTTRMECTATLLPSGKVLVTGGWNGNPTAPNVMATAELYDPTTGTFTPTGSMLNARYSHTATLLKNGKVLIAGGAVGQLEPVAIAELYDPATGAFSETTSMVFPRQGHTAILLTDGRVILAGGAPTGTDVDYFPIAPAELFDPASGNFSVTGSLTFARILHTATLLPTGKVLVTGGRVGTPDLDAYNSASAELYDPATGLFADAGSMTMSRESHTATLLPNGTLLLAAGSTGPWETPTDGNEIYDPSANTFTATPTLTQPRTSHAATLLSDGSVLITGGVNGLEALNTAEIYK